MQCYLSGPTQTKTFSVFNLLNNFSKRILSVDPFLSMENNAENNV